MSTFNIDTLKEALEKVRPYYQHQQDLVIQVSPRTMEAMKPILQAEGLLDMIDVNPYLPEDKKFYVIDRSVIPYASPSF